MAKNYNYYFDLPGITCPNCTLPLITALSEWEDFKIEADDDIYEKNIVITVAEHEKYTLEEIKEKLCEKIDSFGLDYEYKGYEEEDEEELKFFEETENTSSKKIKIHIIKALVGSLGFVIMALMIAGIMFPLPVMIALIAATSILTFVLGAESYREAFNKLFKAKTLTMDTLFTISTFFAVLSSVLGLLSSCIGIPATPIIPETGLIIFGFREFGKVIEESLKNKIRKGLKFRDRAPSVIDKLNENLEIEEVNVSAIKPNDVIIVRAGQTIPLDGECLNNSSVYKTIIFGDPLPKDIQSSDYVLAGMRVAENGEPLKIKVNGRSYLARLDRKIRRANAKKAAIQIQTNKLLQYFIPSVLLFALIFCLIVGIAINPGLAIIWFIALLVAACPCVLGFVPQTSIKMGMVKAMQHGVIFKSGRAFQLAGKIDTVVLDLHGTITLGIPRVYACRILKNEKTKAANFFNYLYLLESESEHPVAKAICKSIGKNKNSKLKITDVDNSNHSGISATINGQRFIVGDESMMNKHSVDLSMVQEEITKNSRGPVVYLACENSLVGYVFLQDTIRKQSKRTIDELIKMDINVHICTGASEATAQYFAKQLGIALSNIKANCTSKEKGGHIRDLRSQGWRVAMVGDAGNDALPIAQSEVGIAIQSSCGDEITQQEADILIANDSLLSIVTTLTVAKQTMYNLKQCLVITLAYNSILPIIAIILVATISLSFPPALGAAVMVGEVILVLGLLYYQKRKSLQHLQENNDDEDLETNSYKKFQENGLQLAPSCQQDLILTATDSIGSSSCSAPCSYSLEIGEDQELTSVATTTFAA